MGLFYHAPCSTTDMIHIFMFCVGPGFRFVSPGVGGPDSRNVGSCRMGFTVVNCLLQL